MVICSYESRKRIETVISPLWRAEQLDSMRGFRRALCTCDTLSAAPFAGTGALTRIDVVDTGAHDSDSAPASARREPSHIRSEARRVRLARSSCAIAPSSQAAQGYPENAGRDNRGRPSLSRILVPA